ncbi:transglycosylase SLT domain-containing protein [Bradyrhizobium sp. 83012]|uniref:Transglycosylase SLT domain-containing protein n=1 Tax=Bradyrhizobium aeschynomenes TaxID=2734909 RepID=A0ABX2CAU1_9BRAD|nr:D-alanyl-D-alanine carboxypeptidase family protein [Bradyrhizobium aeschynomenes]NPU64595.1 transglycosylase SLT domain-containing protein [Bradyrhizobium aeschynomenes]
MDEELNLTSSADVQPVPAIAINPPQIEQAPLPAPAAEQPAPQQPTQLSHPSDTLPVMEQPLTPISGAADPNKTRLDDPDVDPAPVVLKQSPADILLPKLQKGHDASHIHGMNPDLQDRLSRLIEEAPPEVRSQLSIVSGFRSPERQAQLYAEALKKYGSPDEARKWVAPPGQSQHNHGNASDLGYGDEASRNYVHANAARYGLTFPLANEPWHIETTEARSGGAAPKQTVKVPSDIKAILEDAAVRTGRDVNELIAAAKQESDFNPNASNGDVQGLFQFKPKTWAWALEKWGPTHGIPANTPRTNASANAILGAEYMGYVQQEITKQTGAYNKGEQYLGHFLGPTGGANFIRLARSQPDAPAAQYFPGAAASNPSVFYNKDGTPKTAKQIYDWGVAKGGGTAVNYVGSGANSGPVPAAGVSGTLTGLNTPPIKTASDAIQQEDAQLAAEKHASYLGVIGDTYKLDTLTGTALAYQHFAPNPATVPDWDSSVQKWKKAGIPEEIIRNELSQAVSGEHEAYLFDRAQKQTQHMQDLMSLGVGGIAASVVTQMADVPALAAGALSGGLADVAVAARGIGTAGRIGAQMLAGAASNVAIDVARGAMGDTGATDNMVMSAALGAVFGPLGAIGRNPFAKQEASKLMDIAESIAAENAKLPHEMSIGAAQNLNAEGQFLDDKAVRAFPSSAIPKTAFQSARIDMANTLNKSQIKTARVFGNAMLADAVGPEDKSVVNNFTVDQAKAMRFSRNEAEMMSHVEPAFDHWMKENGYNRALKDYYAQQFEEQVFEVQKGIVDPDHYGPAVKRMAAAYRQMYDARARELSNPWKAEGLEGRPLPSFENGPPVENYTPRVTNYDKVSKLINDAGTAALENLWREAMRENGSWLSRQAIDDVARGVARNVQSRANGVWEGLEKGLGQNDKALREFLEEIGASEDTIKEAVSKLIQRTEGSDARQKHRLRINEGVVLRDYPMKDGTRRDISFKDVLETSPSRVYGQYTNWHAGRIELMRMRIANPETGELLVDGIYSEEEFLKKVIQNIQAEGVELNAGKQIEQAADILQWAHDRILGKADPANQTAYAKLLQGVRDYNVVRLMGRMGFSQAAEHGLALASLGLKAVYSQMPAVRSIITGEGLKVPANKLMREILAFTGMDGEYIKNLTNLRIDDYGYVPGSGGTFERAMTLGKKWIGSVSGFNAVNKWMMQGTQRAIAQRFSDFATKAISKMGDGAIDLSRLPARDLSRMRSIGVSDDMLKRILTEFRDNRETRPSLFGEKLTLMNLNKWKDLEARSKFEQALFAWSRRIVQHNDMGNMAKWMSEPLAQALLQFRGFTVNGWAKNTLYNLHQRDMYSVMNVAYGMMTGAMIYALREQISAQGRSDKEAYLEKKLSYDQVLKGAFQLMGSSSIIPMVIDTPIMMTGYKGVFDARSSGQAASLLFGSPVWTLGADLQGALSGIVQPITQGYDRSQQEYRNIAKVLPLGNTVPAMIGLSNLISSAPEKTPRIPKEQQTLF